jgi:hypothetical protein
MLATYSEPPAYHFVVNNFNLDQLGLFEDFRRCPMNCPRNFQLRFQFDSRVLESALELERRVGPWNAPGPPAYKCKISDFILIFGLSHDKMGRARMFADDGDGGNDSGGGGSGGGVAKAMTEAQGRDTVQVMRRIRRSLSSRRHDAGHATLTDICIRFEAMLDFHVARSKGTSNVWRRDGLPDDNPERAEADRRQEEYERLGPAGRLELARRLEAIENSVVDEWEWAWFTASCTATATDGLASSDETASSDALTSGGLDSDSDSDAGVKLPPHHSSWWD